MKPIDKYNDICVGVITKYPKPVRSNHRYIPHNIVDKCDTRRGFTVGHNYMYKLYNYLKQKIEGNNCYDRVQDSSYI